MTAYPQQKYNWLKIHLSTAIILLIVAGGLLGINLSGLKKSKFYNPYELPSKGLHLYLTEIPDIIENVAYTFGWPLDAYEVRSRGFEGRLRDTDPDLTTTERILPIDLPSKLNDPKWYTFAVVVNLGTAFAVLATTAFGCEWYLRRREKN